ncbi:CMGC protein kinase [Apiospora kogelbergensis]|uniref:EKC/KEOPS complex subunit BUD32 n=1 Tax=Apiospora kogelbergensis TaxID=1337665 RepID=A0AAW0QML4_9PEZI
MSISTSARTGEGRVDQVSHTNIRDGAQIKGPKYEVCAPHEYEVEDVEMYKPGGFHPVHLDTFVGDGDRYEYVHKLGQGGFATVWLCRDHQHNRWCALKTIASSHSSEDSGELEIKRLLGRNGIDQREAAAHHIILPSDHFWIQGPNGRHLALVLPLLGPSLSTWLEFNGHKFDAKKKFCRQMTRAIDFLQSQNVCHGDFRPQNILMKTRNLDDLTKDEILDVLGGEPLAFGIRTLTGDDHRPHAPDYAVAPAHWPIEDKHILVLEDIAIADFGESFVPGNCKDFLGIPRAFAAPEVIFMSEPGLPSDIWSLGATILAVLGTSPFFNEVLDVTKALEEYLGPLPVKYRTNFEKLQNETLAGEHEYEKSRWQDYIDMGDASPDDTPELKVFSLTESQRNNPSHPVSYSSVTELEDERNDSLEGSGYSHPISIAINREKEIFFEKTDSRFDPEMIGRYKNSPAEVDMLTDLALRIFRYDPIERITTTEILRHQCLRGKKEEADTRITGALDIVQMMMPYIWCSWPYFDML